MNPDIGNFGDGGATSVSIACDIHACCSQDGPSGYDAAGAAAGIWTGLRQIAAVISQLAGAGGAAAEGAEAAAAGAAATAGGEAAITGVGLFLAGCSIVTGVVLIGVGIGVVGYYLTRRN